MRTPLKSDRLTARIGALKSRHAALDASLQEELTRPAPNGFRVQKLKRMKLRTKDEIASVFGLLRTLGRPATRVFRAG